MSISANVAHVRNVHSRRLRHLRRTAAYMRRPRQGEGDTDSQGQVRLQAIGSRRWWSDRHGGLSAGGKHSCLIGNPDLARSTKITSSIRPVPVRLDKWQCETVDPIVCSHSFLKHSNWRPPLCPFHTINWQVDSFTWRHWADNNRWCGPC